LVTNAKWYCHPSTGGAWIGVMGGAGVTWAIWLLIAVSITASACGYLGSAVSRRKQQRASRSFALGFFCGSITGAVLRRKYRPTARQLLRRVAAKALSAN
jgi:hypothetical protein